ncbi:Protein of unknown function, DUF481 [Flavobacteriaceae bacterium MAR_2010_188]|nr:Protein of unknown function, DUF481 [Flavobacteriaceae bacterium MAR_2010_188]
MNINLRTSKFLIFFILFAINFLSAQIINVESLRKVTDSSKWSGSAGLNLSIIKNTNDIFIISNNIHLQYNDHRHLLLFVNDLNFQKLEENSFINQGTQHLRYNYRIAERVKLEAFLQGQYDAVSYLDFRGLAGIGPRFKLSSNDKYRVYLGTLAMYEYEKASEEITEERVQKDIRGSAYLSFSLYPTDKISLVSTTYYQPKLSEFKDYRISSQTSLSLSLFKNFAFVSTFSYFIDEYPIGDTPKTQYRFTNGIAYTFD